MKNELITHNYHIYQIFYYMGTSFPGVSLFEDELFANLVESGITHPQEKSSPDLLLSDNSPLGWFFPMKKHL